MALTFYNKQDEQNYLISLNYGNTKISATNLLAKVRNAFRVPAFAPAIA